MKGKLLEEDEEVMLTDVYGLNSMAERDLFWGGNLESEKQLVRTMVIQFPLERRGMTGRANFSEGFFD